jgi:protein-disulfide isomerase
MNSRLDSIASVCLAIAALAVTASVVRRDLRQPVDVRKPVYLNGWQSLESVGAWVGDSNAPIKIVEFSDFQCPYCQRFNDSVRAIQARSGNRVGLLYVHFPLPSHKYALAAAEASVCAEEQDRFPEFEHALFAKQDSLGIRPWSAYGEDAGIADAKRFNDCVTSGRTSSRVALGMRVGDSLKVNLTPTILINGWRYTIPPLDSLGFIVDDAFRRMKR